MGLLLALAGLPVHGQGSAEDYARAARVQGLSHGRVLCGDLTPHWVGGGEWFWYTKMDAPRRWRIMRVRSATGEERPAFDHDALAARLGEAVGRELRADRLSLAELTFDPSLAWMTFESDGRRWVYRIGEDVLTEQAVESDAEEPDKQRSSAEEYPRGRRGALSPDGRWRASVREHDVYLQRVGDEGWRRLTEDGSAEDGYVAQFLWSPDSSKLVVTRQQPGDDRQVTIIDTAPDDRLQPRTDSYPYLKPGDRVTVDRPRLFDVERGEPISTDDALAPNPYDIRAVRWRGDSSAFSYEYNQRGHQAYRVIEVDATTGASRAVIDETCETFFCYSSKHFAHYDDARGEIVWMSERSGWNHLYLYDWTTGDVKYPVTSGDWVVRRVDRVDTEARAVWFWAGGIHGGQDPYYLHYCRADLDGGGVTPLTASHGTHTAVSVSPNGRYLVTTWSRVDHPPVHELRDARDGTLICEIARADASGLEGTGWRAMEPFVAKGRDGETDIYGVIVRPTNFDPARRYPVIEYIYAGPHSAFVPKRWTPFDWMMHPMAELGFIIVMIDGMGTSQRSKAFHDVAWRDLADSGFPDRIAWMRAAAEHEPAMDLSRVGIYGGSAGGQSAMRAVLDHADFYDAAAADCGCHDNRMDKIWWNEQWLGWPVAEQYEHSSNVADAHKLGGALFLTVGELDRNVDPASTMQVVDALIAADKDFELLVVTGGGHGSGESRYARRRRADFFVRELLGVEPRWE
jgi:dipeptidyl aminopeptidase/acylaminoacyl peptidase